MKSYAGWILWLLMSLACSASEIVAWKVPLSRFAWNGLKSEGFVRRESAPEASTFLKDGDELWTVGKMPVNHQSNQSLSSDWLIWNASSGRLVAKGGWEQISSLHEFLRVDQLPRHCRLQVGLYPVMDVTLPVSKDSKPIAEVSWLSRSGQKSDARWSGGGNSISVEGEPTCNASGSLIDLRLHCSAKPADQATMEVNTALTIRAGESVWLARDFDGKQGCDLVVSGVIESLDGMPFRERVMIQNGGQVEPLIIGDNAPSVAPIRIGKSGWLARIWASPDLILDCISPRKGDHGADVDPFAEHPPEKRSDLPNGANISPPDLIQPWLHHEVLNAGNWFEACGLRIERDGDFIGYDPVTESLFVYSPNKEFVERFEQLFGVLDGDGPPHLIVTQSGAGQTRLIARSGQKAMISRNVGGEESSRLWEIEPTLGDGRDIVDLRFFFDDKTDPEGAIHLNSAVTLNMGDWLEIAAGMLGEKVKSSLRVKAEIFRPAP